MSVLNDLYDFKNMNRILEDKTIQTPIKISFNFRFLFK